MLEWGGDCVAQALPIAGYLARRLGQYDGLDAMGIARLEMVASVAYMDIIGELSMMLYVPTSLPDAEATARFSNDAVRVLHKVARLDRMLVASDGPFFGGRRPAVADFFVVEALDVAHQVLGERLDRTLGRALRLAEMRDRLARREAIARHVRDGKRPLRITGNPNEAESLTRIRRYVETVKPSD